MHGVLRVLTPAKILTTDYSNICRESSGVSTPSTRSQTAAGLRRIQRSSNTIYLEIASDLTAT